jgi:hypothetical protein
MNPRVLVLASAMALACGPKPLPPELARPPACPDFGPAQAQATLQQARALLAEQGDLDASLELVNRVARCQPATPELAAVEDALGQATISEAQALAEAGQPGAARFALARVSGRLDLGDELRALELGWAAELASLAEADEQAGRWASAWVRRAMAAKLGRREGELNARDQARARFLASGAVAVQLTVDAPHALRSPIELALGAGLGPALRLSEPSEPVDLAATLTLEPPRCDEQVTVSVAQRPARDPARSAALERQAQAKEQVALARSALERAALEDRKLRAALEIIDQPQPQEGAARLLDAPLVQDLILAQAAIAALEPPPQAAEPFSYELSTHTKRCALRAELAIERTPSEPLVQRIATDASCSDSAHPAFLDQDLDQDPLAYASDDAELEARALGAMAERIDRLLVVQARTRGLIGTPVDPPVRGDLAALEAGARAALLGWVLDPEVADPILLGFLAAGFGLEDLDDLQLP